jgi:hypothetical protein
MAPPSKRNRYTLTKQLNELLDIGQGDEPPERGYLARLLFHTMMPHSAQEAQEWSRKNGKVSLYMQAGPRMGLPYGVYPRLVFAWIVTEACRTGSRTLVLGDSLSGFMEQLGLNPTGGRWGTITQLREQMQRLFAARIMAYRDEEGGESGMAMQFANRWELWWAPRSPDQGELWESTVTLGEDFFSEITRSPYPIDLRILRALTRSPLGIDLYTWLTYRVSYLKKPTEISWRQLHDQFGSEYDNPHEFARKAKRELKKIKAAWPGLSYATPRGRLRLNPCNPSVLKTIGGKAA